MLCEECGERPATVHFTEIVQGRKTEFHLCEACAREKGAHAYQMVSGPFSVNQLLTGLMNLDPAVAERAAAPTLRCDRCGMTFAQFSQVGRFGCPHCYQAFSSGLDGLLKRVQSSDRHVGKIPHRRGGRATARRELANMKSKLQECVTEERFEEAAALRDKIRILEQQLSTDTG